MLFRSTLGKAARPPPCQRAGCAGVFEGKARSVYTPASAYLVGNILADRSARAATFGLESWLATPYWAAAKTGTSKDMRDNWCAGYSRRYTVAVWVGNASGSAMHDVSGVSGAAPVWREVMDWLHRGDASHGRARIASRPPPAPPGIISQPIRFDPAREPARDEWFIAGTQTSVVRAASSSALARISYPAEGSIISLDPVITAQGPRVSLSASAPAGAGWTWRIDNKTVARADGKTLWLPQPGKHKLTLENSQGEVLDDVAFEVRAMKGKAR